jgi:hypothetical protein
MREAIKHASCPSCGDIGVGSGDGMPAAGDENQLRSDNARLREEVTITSSLKSISVAARRRWLERRIYRQADSRTTSSIARIDGIARACMSRRRTISDRVD